MEQSTNNILLIKPSNFIFNSQTAVSNVFQNHIENQSNETLQKNVNDEFGSFAQKLRSKGINVIVIDDTPLPQKPDAIFPNNWVSFHADGKVILYPMCAPNRRLERRMDIIDSIKENFEISSVLDLFKHENDNKFLEGTGSIVFDHENKIAYACLSPRTDKDLFIEASKYIGYKPIYFFSRDKKGQEVYHTNVMMCNGAKFAVVCLDSITDEKERKLVADSLVNTGHEIVEITFEQMYQFAGNMLELKTNTNKKILALSETAFKSLTETQKQTIEKYCELVPLAINTIETIGGGSARCMIAEIFLPKKCKII